MRGTRLLGGLVVMLAVGVLFTSCTNDSLDDTASPDVVIEVQQVATPAITVSLDEMTGACTFTISDWSFTMENKPKNSVATTSPFNDVVAERVRITYNWLDTGINTPTRVFGLGDVVVPVNGSNQITFPPLAFDDVKSAIIGRTANLQLLFTTRTIEGSMIQVLAGSPLQVESCD